MIITTSPSALSPSSSLSSPFLSSPQTSATQSRDYQEQPDTEASVTSARLRYPSLRDLANNTDTRAEGEGEATEIAALRTNLTLIAKTVTDVCTTQWFANRLVEKSFITHDSSKGILGNNGLTSAEKTTRLMNSVFTKIQITDKKRHWFSEFVAVFSTEPACAELVERLKGCVSNTRTSPDHPANQPPPSPH